MLVYVVGPSGAGKDTLMNGARARLAGDDTFVFVRRHITRPADAGGEDHIEIGAAEFDANAREGAYILSWQAHGLSYGIPKEIAGAVAAGKIAVVNGSRACIDMARERFSRIRIVHVTAPEAVLRRRLEARGRETMADVQARLGRAQAVESDAPDTVTLQNDSDIETGISRFVALLQGCPKA